MPFAYQLDELFVGLLPPTGYEPKPSKVGNLEYNPHHVRQGVDRLLEQYKRKERIEGMLSIPLHHIAKLEDAFWQILTERWIDTAIGDQLDLLGRVVNLPRDGADDETYRALIRVEILSLRSQGRPEQLITLCRLTLGDGQFTFDESTDVATVLIRTTDGLALPLPPGFYMRLFKRAMAAGVRLFFEYQQQEGTFRFAPAAEVVIDPTAGFGDVNDPATGGKLAGVRS